MLHATPDLNRRTLLQSAAAAAVLSGVPAAVLAKAAPAGVGGLTPLLDGYAQEILVEAPEGATSLGLDKGANAGLKARLSDSTPAGQARATALVRRINAGLKAVDPRTLSEADRVRRDTVMYAAERGIEGAAFSYGGGAAAGLGGGTRPYVVTQQDGAVNQVPEMLDSLHSIATTADAEAYLSRIAEFGRVLGEEADQIAADAAIGVAPPRFIADKALAMLRAYRATPAAGQRLVGSLAARAKQAGLAGDWAGRATALVAQRVYPALDREIAALAAATAGATDAAGVSRLPEGEAYYRWALRLGTTTTMSPAEVHKLGLEQNAALKGRIDGILKSQGMTKGTVGERVTALNKDPRLLFPDTDQGKADVIAYCNERLALIRPLMAKLSHLGLKADVMVKRVPPDIQDGAALGYMNFASLDGSRPAIYYINLKSTALWPKYQIATLCAHEGIPGHTWQGAYLAEHHADIPLISSMLGFNAFVEGWALYAEQLIDESGLYDDDPFSRIGFLQALQFRACRLVADTGLHAMNWTREQTVRFLSGETGKGADAMTSETDRYCVAPGQACGYKVGHTEIVRLRDKAKAALGAKFDLAAFDDAVVTTGGVPLTVLAGVIDRHIAAARG